MKNILIISNNPLSETNNNGKTLASFLDGVEDISVRQLYFTRALPDYQGNVSYFRVTENDLIRRWPGSKIKPKALKVYAEPTMRTLLPRFDALRLVREILWFSYDFDNDELNKWISEENIDFVLFCAGDSLFAYRFFEKITAKKNCIKLLYVTDDYVLPRKTMSIFSYLKRKFVFRYMSRAVKGCDKFITISEKMRNEYLKLYGKDSETFINSQSLLGCKLRYASHPTEVHLVYAGGFHFNRWRSLAKLLNIITQINNNDQFSKKIYLDIYSNQSLSKRQLNFLGCKDYLNMRGFLEKDRLVEKLLEADALIHVEAFDSASIESTYLSISTKIPEYLSSGRPILAIGPKNIASIEHLARKSNALVIDNSDIVSESFIEFIADLVNGKTDKYVTHFDTFEENYGLSKLLNRFKL